MGALSWALVGIPFAAAVIGLLTPRPHRRRVAAPLAVSGAAIAAVTAILLAAQRPWQPNRAIDSDLAAVPTGLIDITMSLRIDGLAAVVALMVVVVALLVQIYSTAYLADDSRYPSYAALVSLFTAAMLLVVVAGDLFVLLVGWEVMGVCSYFLIGHHWERADARPAAVKAFLATRLGDVGFLFGIFVIGVGVGSFQIAEVTARGVELPSTTLYIGTLLLLCGVVGKSAQFPLHVWLPDAMAGPTPISALIHAATMVAAGVYLVTRLWGLFAVATLTLAILGIIAAITMLGAALCALAQDDIKRVLAWSTVSQLAYMFAALSVGAPIAATFHLLTHAAFKALLFLCAGAVIHVVGTNLMSEMGGIRRDTSTAFWTMTVGLAALVGLPPLAGFISKEAVLHAAEVGAEGEWLVAAWVGFLVLVAGLATIVVTAAYATRLWLRTFFGDPRGEAEPHVTPAAMRWPLIVLAVPTVLLGVVGLQGSWLPSWLGPELPPQPRAQESTTVYGPTAAAGAEGFVPELTTTLLTVTLAAIGIGVTYAIWRRDPAADPVSVLGRGATVLARGFGIDFVYDRLIVRPTMLLARAVVRVDDEVVEASVRGTGAGTKLLGGALRLSQNGNLQAYLTGLLAGIVTIVIGVVVVVG